MLLDRLTVKNLTKKKKNHDFDFANLGDDCYCPQMS